ncbi:hypothetical protein E2C01_005471 [Portunus trituberculatus]|uniref:Uncharacterized protein n=1 Tax=Portunus trituberculatus TaxID=210409 RepID=A0A5B7CZ94_PORTR|nr:hypothetical protein [Portunus trituberculatus]
MDPESCSSYEYSLLHNSGHYSTWATASIITRVAAVDESKMLPSSLVFIGVVLVIPIVSPDCRVTPSSRLDVKNQQLTIRFWGFITGIEVHSFLTVVLYDKDLPLLKIECNHTHVTIHASEFKAEKTTTPMWEVGANTQDIAAPRCHDALHFTLQADTIVTPRLTVGNVSLTLHELSLSQPSLSLTVRGTPGATPAVLVAVVCGMTVEVGCTVPTLSLSSENGATFTVTQRIHLQECPPKTHKTKKAQSALFSFRPLVVQAILFIVVPILGPISPPKRIFGVTT